MLSGFRLAPGAVAPEGLIRNMAAQEEKVTLYLDSVRLRSDHQAFAVFQK